MKDFIALLDLFFSTSPCGNPYSMVATGLLHNARFPQSTARDWDATELSKELIETDLIQSGTRPTKAL
ncbi:MAG: hypothetical protein CBB60_002585 [Armatimonadetes bacterium Cent15-Ar3]|nr:MAG: hypothetical protein CBB60_002585 [Armatimonadetes bacterium Cent15-Ar3]